MLAQRRRRLITLITLVVVLAIAVSLVLYALRQNVNLYYTPQQIKTVTLTPNQMIRLGGMVVNGSVQRVPDSLQVSFVLTDYHAQMKVEYNGILPSLFREGQGIVAEGHMNQQGVFIASEVLAKHDSNYHPPDIEQRPAS